jgi:hypothetical protein
VYEQMIEESFTQLTPITPFCTQPLSARSPFLVLSLKSEDLFHYASSMPEIF